MLLQKPSFMGDSRWKLKNLSSITVIFGKNGSGKSILLRTIRDKAPVENHYCVPERGGNISYDSGVLQYESDGKVRMNASQQNLGTDYRSRVITRIGAFLTQRGAFRGSKNTDNLTKIETIMQEILIDFNFQIKSGHPHYQLRRIEPDQIITDIQLLSSGEAQLLTLTLDLLLICEMWRFEGKKGRLLVDEPDSHLHPDMQQRFAKFLTNLNREYGCPIIIATHCTTLLSALGQYGGNKTSVVYVTNTDEMEAIEFSNALKIISTCLGGHALMGPLFNVPILLVEGDDDSRIWSQVPRHGLIHIAVIPCNGNEIFDYQKTLENLFASILGKSSTPTGYALLDSDSKDSGTSQNYIKFLKLSCHESENLYLTDEVLKEMGYDWKTACDKIIKESSRFGNKSEELKNVSKWDRKTVNCKNVINELAETLDEKRLNWAYRLGKVLGEEKPKGQLYDFLGDDAVNSLWANCN
jgi:predicted ATPase